MLANDTEYGLAAYFYTRDLSRAWRIAEQLEYGMVSGLAGGGGGAGLREWGTPLAPLCPQRGMPAVAVT
jgi:acyl-CoA reductase-like NAD-dependent aldehyde dehydrogenase